MAPTPDKKAVYDNRTETVRTGDGRFVRVKDLYNRLATLNQVQLSQLIKRAGVRGAVSDPFDVPRSEVVQDLTTLCRSRPQYCLVVVEVALGLESAGERFAGLLRDRAFGSTEQRAPTESATEEVAAQVRFDKSVGRFFWETREWPGEYQLFVTGDQRTLTLGPKERFDSHEPYEICFVVVRTTDKRFWLRWPETHRDIPAYYIDETEQPVWFFPHPIDGETVDFEELFPGYIYEVFGLQFQLPDIGLDYSAFVDEDLEAFDEWDPSAAATNRRRARGEAGQGRRTRTAASAGSELAEWLVVLELKPDQITTRKALSKHFRKLSLRYHPLKHLDAPDAERDRIAARYLEITTAYNALKETMV